MSSSTDRALYAAFSSIKAAPVSALIATIGTTAAVLFTDLDTPVVERLISITNTHATQTLALIIVPLGQAAGAQTVADGDLILALTTRVFPVSAAVRVLVVGSAAATTFNAKSYDR